MDAIWGWDATPAAPQWRPVLLDAAGNLQVDTVSSALPVGAATAANQALIIADTGALVTEQGRCYGYDTANWQYLQVEAAALHNLRVRLYGGANAVLVGQSSAALAYTNYGIETFAILYGDDGTNLSRVGMLLDGADGVVNTLNTLGVAGMLYGYNGTTWDRLRVESDTEFNLRVRLYAGAVDITSTPLVTASFVCSNMTGLYMRTQPTVAWDDTHAQAIRAPYMLEDGDVGATFPAVGLYGYNGATYDRLRTYGVGVLKVGRAAVGLLTVRMTGTGQVGAAGARKLYWMAVNPSAGNSTIELADAAAGGGAVVFDHYHTDRESHMDTLDPPMEFSNGIYLETFTAMTSVIFGYL